MRHIQSRSTLCTLLLTLATGPLQAQVGSTVPNWTVPPYHTSSDGLTTMTDFTQPRAFVAVVPCRVVDTRNAAGPYGGPALSTNATRTFDIDNGPCPGIPAGAEAYSLSFGAILPPADGFLTAWPTGTAQPLFSQVNLIAGEVVANAAIVPAGTNGAINVLVNIGPTNIYIDINGYFSDTLGNPTHYLEVRNNVAGAPAALFANASNANMSTGVLGLTGPEFPRPGNYRAAGVRGEGTLSGVIGISQSEAVAGSLVNAAGGELAFGLLGFWFGGPAEFANTAGVYGWNGSPFGTSAGVYGVDNGGFAGTAGVRGVSVLGRGVVGRSRAVAVEGQNLDNLDAIKTIGYLGFNDTVGVHSDGTITATGIKSFIEPHPTDPTKEIVYVALEGPEAGTYFRGNGRFQRGTAVIEPAEDFRMVTDPQGLSVQITPIGEMATFAVVSISLDRIVVKASRDVAFFYTVNGIRKGFEGHEPIAENTHYIPHGPTATMPGAYTPEQRRRLIATGIYNEDGTVNTETARRLGWDKTWEKRSRPTPQPTEP